MLLNKTSLAAIILTCATAVNAAPTNKWYAGADVQWDHFTNSSTKPNLAGLSIFGGHRWNFLGAELGLTGYSGNDAVVNYTKPRYNIYLDGNYYVSLMPKLELKALLGLGYLYSQYGYSQTTRRVAGFPSTNTYTYTESSGKLGVRLGLGLQYDLTNHVSTSLMYKFQTYSKFGISNVQTVALGLAYAF